MANPTIEQYQTYSKELERDLEVEKHKTGELTKGIHGQMNLFNEENEQNLIKWQLDLREDLDRLYHLLKGDILKEVDGEIDYVEPKDPNNKPFNEFGVQLLMNIMMFYLNRNTILSNYDLKTIEWKVLDFGITLSDLIFNKYHEMMNTMDTKKFVEELIGKPVTELPNGKFVTSIKTIIKDGKVEIVQLELGDSVKELVEDELQLHIANKLKLYPMINQELVDMVHSAYLRAYNGGERESLRTARTVTQTEPLGRNIYGGGQAPIPQVNVRRRWYNPTSW